MSPADASGMVGSTRPPRVPMPPLDSQPQKPPLRPTEVEQERFARHSLEEIATRLRAGLAVAVPVALVIGTIELALTSVESAAAGRRITLGG